MTEMVERVAAIIAAVRMAEDDDYDVWDNFPAWKIEIIELDRRIARKLIEAMRDVSWERTPAILDAGFAAMREGPVKEQTQRLWHAMIDEALK